MMFALMEIVITYNRKTKLMTAIVNMTALNLKSKRF